MNVFVKVVLKFIPHSSPMAWTFLLIMTISVFFFSHVVVANCFFPTNALFLKMNSRFLAVLW